MTVGNADIGILAATAYETGIDPIEYAVTHVIRAHIDAHFNPGGFPGELDPATGPLSCRILGDLMGAGWKAPEVTK